MQVNMTLLLLILDILTILYLNLFYYILMLVLGPVCNLLLFGYLCLLLVSGCMYLICRCITMGRNHQ